MASNTESSPAFLNKVSTPRNSSHQSFKYFNFGRDSGSRYTSYSMSRPDRGYSEPRYSAEKRKSEFKSDRKNYYRSETPKRSRWNLNSNRYDDDKRSPTSHHHIHNLKGKRLHFESKRHRDRSEISRHNDSKPQKYSNDYYKLERPYERSRLFTNLSFEQANHSKVENSHQNIKQVRNESRLMNGNLSQSSPNPTQNARSYVTNSESKTYDVTHTSKHQSMTSDPNKKSSVNPSSSDSFTNIDDLKNKSKKIMKHYKIPLKSFSLIPVPAQIESSDKEPDTRPKMVVKLRPSPPVSPCSSTPPGKASTKTLESKIKKSRIKRKLSSSSGSESGIKMRSIIITTADSKTVIPYYMPIQSQQYSKPSTETTNIHARPVPSFSESKSIQNLKRKDTEMHSNSSYRESKILKVDDANENNLKFVIKLSKSKSSFKEKLFKKFQVYKSRLASLGTEKSTTEDKISNLEHRWLLFHRDHMMLKKSIRDCAKENWSQLSSEEIRKKKKSIFRKINLG